MTLKDDIIKKYNQERASHANKFVKPENRHFAKNPDAAKQAALKRWAGKTKKGEQNGRD